MLEPALMIRMTRPAPDDWPRLGEAWRAIEQRAGASFFQSWTWIGCDVARRFNRPVLFEALHHGALVGIALFNAKRSLGFETLSLHETGDATEDAVFIEHNGPLVVPGHEAAGSMLLEAAGKVGALVLSGVSPALESAAAGAGWVRVTARRDAPFAALRPLRTDPEAGLSRNTRQQLRRSARAYEASGALLVQRADTVAEALAWFAAMAVLHTRTWQARGEPGAFANPAIARFHQGVIESGVPRGEVDLLRVSAGQTVLGYLYNVRSGGRVFAYQSGFDYAAEGSVHKPGMTCHSLALRYYAAQGCATYEFLAGDSRYKRSLASGADTLVWLRVYPVWHPGVLGTLVRRLRSFLPKRPA